MSKINGDKKRENLRARRQEKMRNKIRALREAHAAKSKGAPKAEAAK